MPSLSFALKHDCNFIELEKKEGKSVIGVQKGKRAARQTGVGGKISKGSPGTGNV